MLVAERQDEDAVLREGFRDATLDAIANGADVSKQTIYSHFGDKEALFVAVVEAARARGGAHAQPRWQPDSSDVRGSLAAFGEAMLEVSMSEDVAALRRVMIAELARRPALRELWNSGTPNDAAMQLATGLHTLAAAGVLDLPDVGAAVTQFVALLGGPANTRSLYGVVPLGDDDRREIAASAADMFVRAYAAH